MSTPRRRGTALVSLLLLIAPGAAACSGDDNHDEPSSAASPSRSPSPEPAPEVKTQVSVERVPGKLPKDARKRVQRQVGEVVDRWFDAAYVGGKYPRSDFRDAFPGFTASAKAQAHHDRALMSNDAIGKNVDAVTATRRRVWIDVLPAGGRAAGATARFALDFTTSGKADRKVAVRGRLFLVPGPHGWKVFGYDVAKGAPDELQPPKPKPSKKPAKHHQHDRAHHKGKHHAKGGGR